MDLIDFARYLGALTLVLALVGFAALAARRFGLPGIVAGSSTRRLAVVETLMLDARHKLFILRRDDKEHLVLIGPEGTSVVESGIPARMAAPASSAMASSQTLSSETSPTETVSSENTFLSEMPAGAALEGASS